jgi:hemolysin activation/secretion protein
MRQRLLALFLTSLSFLAQAQVTQNITPQQQRQIEQLNVDRDRFSTPLPPLPGVDLRILTPEKTPVPRAVDELEFQITRVDVEGATYFSRVEIDALFLPLLNRAVNLSALRDAALVLEQKYRERGFFLVRVFIPPQQIKDGIFRVRVVEGYISDVFMDGADELSNERVKTFASNLIGVRPLSLGELERTLLLINDLLGVSASAVLRPGQELGTSDLLLTVKTADPIHILTFNNTGSKTTGPLSLNYNATLIQPFKTPGLSFRATSASPSIWRLPICPRILAALIWRLRSAYWPPAGKSMRKKCTATSSLANCLWAVTCVLCAVPWR